MKTKQELIEIVNAGNPEDGSNAESFVKFLAKEDCGDALECQTQGGIAGVDSDGFYWYPTSSLPGKNKTEIREYIKTLPVVRSSIKFFDDLINLDFESSIPFPITDFPDGCEPTLRKYRYVGLQLMNEGFDDAMLFYKSDLLEAIKEMNFDEDEQ